MEDAQAEIAHQSHTWKNLEEIFRFSHDQPIQISIMMQHHALIEFFMSVASLSGRKYGVHKKVVYVHAATLKEAEYKLKL